MALALDRDQEWVLEYYRRTSGKEWRRLVRDPFQQLLELETTLRYLWKYLPAKGEVLDAGGGPGRYTLELAGRGYRATLLDLSPELLVWARAAIRKSGLARQVRSVAEGDLRDLSRFPDGSFDAALCLGGALGHLLKRKDRRRALSELRRVVKPGAPLFVSVIGRLAALQGELFLPDSDLTAAPEIVEEIRTTGDYHGERGFAPTHFFRPEELERELRSAGIPVLERVGLEGLSTHHRTTFDRLTKREPELIEAWLRLHAEVCTEPAVVAMSHHFLFVGRRPAKG